jgi:hypothetical protein
MGRFRASIFVVCERLEFINILGTRSIEMIEMH